MLVHHSYSSKRVTYFFLCFFQPKIDFSSPELFQYALQQDEIYKVWPRHQSLAAFVEGTATQLITKNAVNFFSPLAEVGLSYVDIPFENIQKYTFQKLTNIHVLLGTLLCVNFKK